MLPSQGREGGQKRENDLRSLCPQSAHLSLYDWNVWEPSFESLSSMVYLPGINSGAASCVWLFTDFRRERHGGSTCLIDGYFQQTKVCCSGSVLSSHLYLPTCGLRFCHFSLSLGSGTRPPLCCQISSGASTILTGSLGDPSQGHRPALYTRKECPFMDILCVSETGCQGLHGSQQFSK